MASPSLSSSLILLRRAAGTAGRGRSNHFDSLLPRPGGGARAGVGVGGGGVGAGVEAGARGLANAATRLRARVDRKMKQKVDRLASDGPDPAASYKHGWRLGAAAMLERYPVLTPDKHPFEVEYERGRLAYTQLCSRPAPKALFLSERQVAAGETEPDFSDPAGEGFEPAPRTTEADRTNDVRSLKRALTERLYFLVGHGGDGDTKKFRFPQTLVRDPGEDADVPLMNLAERAFKAVTFADRRPEVAFISYSPSCHIEHVYPVDYQQRHDVYGVKIFFYRAVLLNGAIDAVRGASDYMWAREQELPQLLGEQYFDALRPVMIGNGPRVVYDV